VIRKLYPFYTFAAARIIDTLITTRLIWPKEKLYDMDAEQYTQVSNEAAWFQPHSKHGATDYLTTRLNSKTSKNTAKRCWPTVSRMFQSQLNFFNISKSKTCPEPALKLEHDFALAIEKQIRSGFPFDVDACLDLVDDLRAKQAVLEADLKKLFPLKKIETIFCTEGKQCKSWLCQGSTVYKSYA
jgi:hypothetical protein